MLRAGKDVRDARNGGCSGCVETGAFGTEAYILTGYFNLPKILELTLNDGFDKRTGKQIGLKTGTATDYRTYEELFAAYKAQVQHFMRIKLTGNNIIERIFMKYMPVPFLSVLIEDCIRNGKDYMCGGARYNSSYVQGVGLGSITDMLTALRYHVYDKKTIAMETMEKALANDFKGFEELQYQLVYHTPKYGNDDDYADEQEVQVFDMYYDVLSGHKSPRGADYRVNMLPTTCHVYRSYSGWTECLESAVGRHLSGPGGRYERTDGSHPFCRQNRSYQNRRDVTESEIYSFASFNRRRM